ncbi:ATP-dependent RNA helicase DeaD [Litorivivens lipolytica]|uniref:ATP-dependent RNA helicase DeaD n=1 Tax=Litorivivens lipolytica TaxID=1524264 RepID=A0A7W4Z5C2_9GAMM|nr:DEAD/DEAH box helicase [Litorivivens lipolytica]MBB3045781.1 ATP-dependent RNA helicase DeaD [Litorivivens lipolytica]
MTQSAPATFADLGLPANLLEALSQVGYEQPSPIQAQAIPSLLQGKDLLGTAQTGTGKTAAFALPVLANINVSVRKPQALILAPTRELAIQVAEACKTYASKLPGFRVLPVYGGQGMGMQLKALREGVHVIVGTPGRVMDHLRRGTLSLDALQTVVLDEADEMLRMGFIDDVTWILDQTPEQRQVALFSATMPPPIRKITKQYLNEPVTVAIEPEERTVARIEQWAWQVSGTNKLDALTRILEVEDFDGVIMFVRTKNQTVELAEKLEARGYRTGAINGDMTQQLRERTIEHLKTERIDIVVATDVAARGIDVARITHVINFDIPYDAEAYTHRIGRTGRAGRSGKAILFVAPREKRMLKTIERVTGQSVNWLELPTREAVNLKRIDEFKNIISSTLESEDLTFFCDLLDSYLEESGADPARVAAALAFMAQRDRSIIPPPARKEREFEGKSKPVLHEPTLAPEDVAMETFRMAVGKQHNVTKGDIVGAIANEAGIENRYIGKIRIFQDYSIIELPDGMPNDLLAHLRKVRVRQQPMMLERAGDEKPKRGPKKPGPKKPGGKSAAGKKAGAKKTGKSNDAGPKKPSGGPRKRPKP